MIEEVWKDVVGFEDYFRVSNTGKVWSKRTNKLLKQTKLQTGYLVINSRIGGRNGRAISLRVHRLVAEAFLEPPSQFIKDICLQEHHGKVLVRHIDNNKENNNFTNLVWGTSQDNSNDYVVSGKSKEVARKGEDHPCAKLSLEDVQFIRTNYVPRDRIFGCRALSRKFGIAHTNVLKIINNKAYK